MSDSLPTTIKAIQIPQNGGPEVIQLNSIPFPAKNPSQILVRVVYSGINYIDTYHRSGVYPTTQFPRGLGTEGSGVIIQLPTDEKVLQDPEYIKRGFKVGARVGIFTSPSLSEYLYSPWDRTFPLPDSVSLQAASASILQGLTALSFITEAYNVQSGDWILVHAAAGGLGLLLTQLASARGAHVIGTTSTHAKAQLAKENGAEHIIVYSEEDVVKRVLELTGGQGVHAIFDGVGKDTWEGNFTSIRRKGTIVSIGNASGVTPPFAALRLGEKNIKICRPTVFNYIATPEESSHYSTAVLDLVAKGQLKQKIHKEYPFTAEGVAQAHTDISSRGTTGKLLIKVSDE